MQVDNLKMHTVAGQGMWPTVSVLIIFLKPLLNAISINRIPDHLICLLRNLYKGQEATVRTGHGTTDWSQIGKEVHQGCIL